MSGQGVTIVTRVELETSEAGIDVEVTVRRVGAPFAYLGPKANAADLPPDVADSLRAWLEGAPTARP